MCTSIYLLVQVTHNNSRLCFLIHRWDHARKKFFIWNVLFKIGTLQLFCWCLFLLLWQVHPHGGALREKLCTCLSSCSIGCCCCLWNRLWHAAGVVATLVFGGWHFRRCKSRTKNATKKNTIFIISYLPPSIMWNYKFAQCGGQWETRQDTNPSQ